MLCQRCDRGAWSKRLLRFWTSPRAVWGTTPLSDVICIRCGAVLPVDLVAERFLGKLSHLSQFGLGAAEGPLLKSARREDS
jgi:hypothetical protein